MWLNKNAYACAIQSIDVQYTAATNIAPWPVLQLPWAGLSHLKALKLPRCTLEAVAATADHAAPSTSAPAGCTVSPIAAAGARTTAVSAGLSQYLSLAALTALTRLELWETYVDLSQLSSCTGLQHLHVDHLNRPTVPATAAATEPHEQEPSDLTGPSTRVIDQYSPAEMTSAVSQLTQLTHLSISCTGKFANTVEDLQNSEPAVRLQLSGLQQLQELSLEYDTEDPAQLVTLPTSLTLLHWAYAGTVTTQTVPDMQLLTQLQELQIFHALPCDAAILSGLVQLTCLHLMYSEHTTAAQVEGLLSALLQLTQLKRLNLAGSLLGFTRVAEHHAALTASSGLLSLDLSDGSFPAQVSKHVFPDQGPGLALTSLVTDSTLLDVPESFMRLASCCPALQQLEVRDDPFARPSCLASEVQSW